MIFNRFAWVVALTSILVVSNAPSVGIRSSILMATGPSTFTVTNVSGSDTVSGSLPWAIKQANNNHNGLDNVVFNIPGPGVHRINIELTQFLNEPINIDGTTQPGYAGSPLVYVQGWTTSVLSSLFLSATPGNTIKGLGMIWYLNNAITFLSGSDNNIVADNWIGFTNEGAVLFKNSDYFALTAGIGIQSNANLFLRNTISGVYNGVVIGEAVEGSWSGRFYDNNVWQYNRVGTNAAGTAIIGNQSDGIFFGAGARNSTVGPWNVFGGNESTGVELLHSSNTNIVTEYNFIGVDPSGTISLPNNDLGVQIDRGAQYNLVFGNQISGNLKGGVSVGGGSVGNYVMNNNIGLNYAQNAALGTQNVGVSVNSGATSTVIQGNVIGGHTEHGIIIGDASGNGVFYNWIGMGGSGVPVTNGAYGIMFLNTSYDWVTGNAMGANAFGPYGFYQTYQIMIY
jgi:hypothetical protein